MSKSAQYQVDHCSKHNLDFFDISCPECRMEQNLEPYDKWLERLVERLRTRVISLTTALGWPSPNDDLHQDMLIFDSRPRKKPALDLEWLRDEIEREKSVRRMNDERFEKELAALKARMR